MPQLTAEQIRSDQYDPEENYSLLRGDKQPVSYLANGRLAIDVTGTWTDEYTREQYLRETDELIGRCDGSITDIRTNDIYDPRIEKGESHVPDAVVYLDKSARPVEWLVDAFWDQMAKEGAKKPRSEFLNIDRGNWFTYLGYATEDAQNRLGRDDFDIEKVSSERIAAIRALYTVGELSEDNWQQEVWNLPTKFDGKHLLVVDEVRNKGGTLYIATEVLRRALPETTVDGVYFWHAKRFSIDGRSADSDSQQMGSVPLWYSKTNKMGRGVGDVSLTYYEHEYEKSPNQDTLRKKLAAFALSAPHHNEMTLELKDDPAAAQLKQDIAYMTYALGNKNIVRFPSPERVDDYDKIMQKQGFSPAEARVLVSERDKKNKDATRRSR